MTADDLVDKYPALFASAFPSIGEGWLPLLETLCSRIELHYKWKEQGGVKIIEAEEEPPEDGKYLHRFYFSQIKEKFRGLRAYSYGGDEYTQGLVDMAEAMSYHIPKSKESTMRTTSLKTIYLSENELKQAIANFVRDKEGTKVGLYAHIMNNACEMEWTQDGGEFLVSMDGELEDTP